MQKFLYPLPLLFLLSACLTSPADGSAKVQTTSEAKRESITGAVASPLRDVNVLRTKIPPILLEAMADPYQRPNPATCAGIAAAIVPLNEALGADLDHLSEEEQDMMDRGKGAALGAVAGLASSVIPFRSWVRQLSGAERHDSLVTDAVMAGAVRRAYMKGLGEAKSCRPPATASHVRTGQTDKLVPTQGPRYPVR